MTVFGKRSYPVPEGCEACVWWRIYAWGWAMQARQPRYCSEVNLVTRRACLNTLWIWEEHING